MSRPRSDNAARALHRSAPVFAALGDQTRLAIVMKLAGGTLLSISRLSEGSPITRQAVTKHLRVLQDAGLVRSVRRGRENLFELEPKSIDEVRRALDSISQQWDEALARLKAFVEE